MGSKQLKYGVILSYGSTIIKTITTIVYIPVLLRLLGQSEYGLYQLVFSTVSYLSLLSFGLTSSYIRFYSIEKKNANEQGIDRLNGLFMIVMVVISILACLGGMFLRENINIIFERSLTSYELETAKILMSIAIINIAIKFPSSVFSCYISAHEQYIFQRGFLLLTTVLEPVLTIPLLLLGSGSIGIISVITALGFLELLSSWIYAVKYLGMKFDFTHLQFGLLKKIYVFSFFVFLSNVTTQINWSVDKFLLGIYKGTIAVAVYSLASQVNTMFCTFGTTISSVFIPRINKMVSEGDKEEEINELFVKVGRIQFEVLMLIFTGFILWGKSFVKIWGGDGYEDAYYVAIILLLSAIPGEIQNLGIQIQMAKNMHRFRSVCFFLIALFNVVISIPLCKQYGVIGSAIGTSIALVFGSWIAMNIYYQRYIGLNIKRFWLSILHIVPSILVSLFLGIIIVRFIPSDSIYMIILSALLYTSIYLVMLSFFGFNDYERNLLIKSLKKIIASISSKGRSGERK